MPADTLSLFSIILTVALAIGGILAYRKGMASALSEIQERVINALNTEMTQMRAKIETVERENHRLTQVIGTICAALKQRGLAVSIDGDMVNIRDATSGATTTARITEAQP